MEGITATIWASQTTLAGPAPGTRSAATDAGNEETTARRQAEDGPAGQATSEIAT